MATNYPVTGAPAADDDSPRYKDNEYNRRVGRVGKLKGTHVIRKKSPQSTGKSALNGSHQLNQSIITPDGGRQRYVHSPSSTNSQSYQAECQVKQAYPQLQNIDETDVYVSQQEAAENVDLQELTSCMQNCLNFDEASFELDFDNLQLDEKPVGCGDFGEVFTGKMESTMVAFKKLHFQRMSKKQKEIFTKEISVLVALRHPYVVRVFGAIIEEDKIGIVMECLSHSLHHKIFVQCVHLAEEDRKRIIGQIAGALQYLHIYKPPIAHYNINDRNILFDESGNAKLSDCGLYALRNATELFQKKAVRIDHYSAPEVLRGEIFKSVEQYFPADVYSLSIVVLAILSEEMPFDGLSIKQLEENVGRRGLHPTLPAALTQPIKDLLKNCWNVDSSKRPTALEFQCIWSGIEKQCGHIFEHTN